MRYRVTQYSALLGGAEVASKTYRFKWYARWIKWLYNGPGAGFDHYRTTLTEEAG